jgi:hypothetical protein
VELEKKGPRELLKQALDRNFALSVALRLVCRDISLEWLLTHENSILRESGKQLQDSILDFDKIDPSIAANCSTVNQVIANYQKYIQKTGAKQP